ncbi:MAG: hypothetical protein WDN49_00085 [Acetobacteraceae bacterium]
MEPPSSDAVNEHDARLALAPVPTNTRSGWYFYVILGFILHLEHEQITKIVTEPPHATPAVPQPLETGFGNMRAQTSEDGYYVEKEVDEATRNRFLVKVIALGAVAAIVTMVLSFYR